MADAGSPDNKTVPNQQDSTTGPNKRQAATDFPMYEKLPAELQTMIWTEALRTPCVEYGRLERVDQFGSQTWTVKLQRQPAKNAARSSSGLAGEVSRLTAAGAVAVRLALGVPRVPGGGGGGDNAVRVPFPAGRRGTPGRFVNGGRDLMVFEFATRGVQAGRTGPWNAVNQVAGVFPPLDRAGFDAMFRDVRNVGVWIDRRMPLATTRTATFRCRTFHGAHANTPVCPEELVGFVDSFPDVEALYFVVDAGMPLRNQREAATYAELFFSVPSHVRASRGWETFYDRERPLVEVPFHPGSQWGHHSFNSNNGNGNNNNNNHNHNRNQRPSGFAGAPVFLETSGCDVVGELDVFWVSPINHHQSFFPKKKRKKKP